MSKSLLNRFLSRAVRKGILDVTFADGSTKRMGSSEPGFPEVAVRFTTAAAERKVILDPRLGAGEAFMDGLLKVL